MIVIERMNADHCQAVASLEQASFTAPWSENSIRSELENPLSYWLVALNNGVVVGYIGSQTVMGEADMMNLAVDANYRGRGIGRKLVETLIADLKEREVYSLTLEVRVSNESAIRLYKKCGFDEIGRRPGYYYKPTEDAFVLRKEWAI